MVKYKLIQFNETQEGKEIIFPENGKWYRIKGIPEKVEEIRKKVEELLETEVDLTDCEKEEIPETYPL